VFEDTPLEYHAKLHGMGLWVVRGALPPAEAERYFAELERLLEAQEPERGIRSVAVQGGAGRCYRAMQAATYHCTCKYDSEGAVHHALFKMRECPVIAQATEWLHQTHKSDDTHRFNRAQANVYERVKNEWIPWHSDRHGTLNDDTEVMSLSLGAPGVYCFCLNDLPFTWNMSTWEGRRELDIAHKLRGCTPLFAGDLLLTTGTFHVHMQHKTLKFSEIYLHEELLNDRLILHKYPGTSAESKALLARAFCTNRWHQRDRGVITWRRIVKHQDGCPNGTTAIPQAFRAQSREQSRVVSGVGSQGSDVSNKRLKWTTMPSVEAVDQAR